MESNNYDLALGDEVDLDNKQKVTKSAIKLLIVEIVLQICYLGYPLIAKLFTSQIIRLLIIFGFTVFFGIFANYFALTNKVFNKRLKQGKVIGLTIVFFFFLAIIVLMDFIYKSKMLHMSAFKVIGIIIVALNAAICEEYLFRGILFNDILLALHKNKYGIFWAASISSLLFSMLHLFNLTHQPLISTIGQMIFAFNLGLMLCYLRLISNAMIWGILLHFWQDMSPQIATSNFGNSHVLDVIIVNGPVIIFMLVTIFAFNRRYLNLRK